LGWDAIAMIHRALIVGLGRIGMGYDLELDPRAFVYSHARAVSVHPQFRLAGAVDLDPALRETCGRAYGCPVYSELALALERENPDVVIIATPTASHAGVLRETLARTAVRAILCEKPLSYDLPEASAMVEECTAREVALYVNYMRRSDSGVIEIKRRLMAGEIRTPVKAVVWYSKGFVHNGSHFFNLMEYWLGEMRAVHMLNPGRRWNGSDPEPDVEVRFDAGTAMFLAAREECFSHYTVELIAANGRLRYDGGGRMIQWQPALADPRLQGYTTLSAQPEIIPTGMERSQLHVIHELANALSGRAAQLCSGAEALRTLASIKTTLEHT
jgi:predicted dehydrogenase